MEQKAREQSMSEAAAPYAADDAIRFTAQVFKVQTLVDGGTRLTLDVQPDDATIVKLFRAKQPGVLLEVAALAIIPEKQENNRTNAEVPARSELQS
jgi:hypothetical protein